MISLSKFDSIKNEVVSERAWHLLFNKMETPAIYNPIRDYYKTSRIPLRFQ